jgi:hypothetical protein
MNDGLDEAESILEEVIASGPPGDEFVGLCQNFMACLAVMRLAVNGDPENSEEAIYRARAVLASSSVKEATSSAWSCVLENAANHRFQNFGPIGGLEPSSSGCYLLPVAEAPPPFELLEGIRNYDITDIDGAIEKGRSIVASSNPNDLYAPILFGEILFEAFERTNKIEYLIESIITFHQLLARPLPKTLRLFLNTRLYLSLAISPGLGLA